MDLARVRFVLVRTRKGGNLGSAARAMKNGGLSRLVLVDPRVRDWASASRMAVHAEDVLEGAERAADLGAAVAGARWVVGTTSRALPGQRHLPPRALAEEARAAGDVAVVFGDEESGLWNDELLACHDLSVIPTSSAQPSVNLAMAVQIYAYELYLAARARPADAVERAADEEPSAAIEGEYALIERALARLLEASRFADPARPRHGFHDLAHTLRRSRLTTAEARLWQAALFRAADALDDSSLAPGLPKRK